MSAEKEIDPEINTVSSNQFLHLLFRKTSVEKAVLLLQIVTKGIRIFISFLPKMDTIMPLTAA